MENIFIHDGRVYQPDSGQLFEGFRPIEIPKQIPTVRWKGAPIPLPLIRQVVAFFAWSYDESDSETQARFFYNPETGEWKAWAFPQEYGSGMSAKEIPGDEFDRQRALIGDGFWDVSTWHHHCDIGAFQSGTDKKDELDENQQGLHVTIGNLKNKDAYSFHARVVRHKTQYEPNLAEWFDVGVDLSAFSYKVVEAAAKDLVCKAFTKEEFSHPDAFPKQWRDNLIKTHKPAMVHYGATHWQQRSSQPLKVNGYQQPKQTSTVWLDQAVRRMLANYKEDAVEIHQILQDNMDQDLIKDLTSICCDLGVTPEEVMGEIWDQAHAEVSAGLDDDNDSLAAASGWMGEME